MTTTMLAIAAALACAACSTGPLDSPTTGTWQGTFAFTFTSSDTTAPQNHSVLAPGSMILTLEGTNGVLKGNYGYSGFPAGAGTIGGTLSSTGAIAISQFGDAGSALGATIQFLHNNWPNCDFTQAETSPFTGTLVDNDITLRGGLTAPCSYTINQQQVTLPTTMIEVVTLQAAQTGNGSI